MVRCLLAERNVTWDYLPWRWTIATVSCTGYYVRLSEFQLLSQRNQKHSTVQHPKELSIWPFTLTESWSCFSEDCDSPVDEELDALEGSDALDTELRSAAVLDEDDDDDAVEAELDCCEDCCCAWSSLICGLWKIFTIMSRLQSLQ